MSHALALAGWVAALLGGLLALGVRRSFDERMEAVARACHELRGPLTAARLGLALAGREAACSPGRLRAVDSELGRAALALEDLADPRGGVTRLRTLERIDVRALLSDSVEAWQGSAAAAGVTLSMEWRGDRGLIWGDRPRLSQAVGNLVANAIEHGGAAVRVRGAVRRGKIQVTVSDEGPGLPAPVEELCRRPRRGRGARGRGLAITAAIAAAHHGRLASAPAPRGACLVLELPAAASARCSPPADRTAVAVHTGSRGRGFDPYTAHSPDVAGLFVRVQSWGSPEGSRRRAAAIVSVQMYASTGGPRTGRGCTPAPLGIASRMTICVRAVRFVIRDS